MRPRICIIGGACTVGDAISAAIVADCRALLASGEFDPFLLSGRCEIDIPNAEVRGLKGLLYHPRFVDADVRLYHFGFYTDLMESCVLGSDRIKRIVRYHNITPPEFVDPSHRERIEKAHRQVAAIAGVDEVWPITRFNGISLQAMGFPVDLDKTLTMPVSPVTRRLDLRSKGGPITIAFVGRIVPSKGIDVLLDAYELLKVGGHDDVELLFVGSTYLRGYAAKIQSRIKSRRLKNVQFFGRVSPAKLSQVYEKASIVAIPSFHEGLCVPVVEALQAGAFPVVSDTSALPDTLNGFGRLTPPGDATALASCLKDVVADIRAIRRDPRNAKIRVERGAMSLDDYKEAVSRYLASYSPEATGAELIRRLRNVVGHTA